MAVELLSVTTMRPLVILAALFALPFALGACGGDAEGSDATNDADLVKQGAPSPSTNVRYKYVLQGMPLPNEFCWLSFWVHEWEQSDNKPIKDSAVAHDGIPPGIDASFDMPYGQRSFGGTIVVHCKRGKATAELAFSGAADPSPGAKQLITASITKLDAEVDGVLSETTPISIELRTIRIDSAP